jgi:hypothetical protein
VAVNAKPVYWEVVVKIIQWKSHFSITLKSKIILAPNELYTYLSPPAPGTGITGGSTLTLLSCHFSIRFGLTR